MSDLLDDVVETQVVEEPALPLPGGVLRATREAYGYSLSEVSQALKFGVRQLEALENDDYSTLQGTTFIRGFVRSYARYLKLDEVPLLAALEPKAPVAVVEMGSVEGTGAAMPVGAADGSKRTYWLAVAVLLLGGVAWFAWQGGPASEQTDELAAPASAPVAAEQSAVVQPAPVTIQPDVPATKDVPVSVPTTPAAGTEPVAEPVVEAAPVSNPDERQLVFSFSDVSWVEVRDASQRILYSGRSTPGSRQSVRGRPPFQLVVGNAQAVKLRYEDRSIDLQPYTRVDVARLTLDDNTK